MMKSIFLLFYFFLIASTLSYAANTPHSGGKIDQQRVMSIEELKDLTLEQLSTIETIFNPKTTGVSRKDRTLNDTAAALFVISQDDMRRAGVTHLAEALRMVPGVQVARISPHQWAISVRGLNEQHAGKLMVMIDGRTVYSPLSSDINWDVQNIMVEDIDRIEVIRGPNAALWGSNAFNGFVNIVSKNTSETQGNLASMSVGKNEEQAVVEMRHGNTMSKGHYRVYGKLHHQDVFVNAQGESQKNAWQTEQGGFRGDWHFAGKDYFTLQGDLYTSQADSQTWMPSSTLSDTTVEARGFNLLSRWQHQLTQGEVILQTYYDSTHRQEVFYREDRTTYDIDLQHRWEIVKQDELEWELLWGTGWRYTQDDIEGSPTISFDPSQRQDNLFNLFVQSEFVLPQKVRLTLGTRFEENNYTGFESHATGRLFWNLNPQHIFWGAVAQARYVPSRDDEDIKIDFQLPDMQVIVYGNPLLKPETLLTYEFGYRFSHSNNKFLVDIGTFHNQYDQLRTTEPLDFKAYPLPVLTQQVDNQMAGNTYGLEVAAFWQASEKWKLIGTYSYLNADLFLNLSSRDKDAESLEKNSPKHQITLRSMLDLPNALEFDTTFYYVDDIPNQQIPAYTRLDMRLGWRSHKRFEIVVGGRNLLDKQHSEFGTGNANIAASEIPRAFYLQLKYLF